MKRATITSLPFFGLLATTAILAAAGAPIFEITRSTIYGGGVVQSSGGDFELSATIGQPVVGMMAGGAFQLSGGFWFVLAPTDCNEDGLVNLFDHDVFAECMLGPTGGLAPSSCACFDVDGDGHVTLVDYARLQFGFGGE